MFALAIVVVFVSVAITYLYLRSQAAKSIHDNLVQFLPPENCLTWRLTKSRTVVPGTTSQLVPRASGETSDENNPAIEFRDPFFKEFRPGGTDWMKALGLTAAALDGVHQVAPLLVQFDGIELETLKHGVEKTIDFIAKIETLGIHFNHIAIAAEHGHEAWLTALGTLFAKHMATSAMDHAAAVKASLADMAHHAGTSVVDAHQGVAEGVLHGVPGAEHAAFLADAHIPFITIAFSSYREFNLLMDEKTTVLNALKNVAIDTAAVATGGFGGMKLGAALGTAFAPGVGTVIGAIIGGVGLSIAGKIVATEIRHAGFETAKSAYLSGVDLAKLNVDSLIQTSQANAKRLQEDGSKEFEAGRTQLVHELREKLAAEIARCEARVDRMTEDFPLRLRQLAAQLEEERRSILATIPQPQSSAFLWPDKSDIMRRVVGEWFQRAATIVTGEVTRYASLPDQSTSGRVTEIRRFLAHYRFQLDQLDADIREVVTIFDEAKVHTKDVQATTVTKVEILRQALISRVSLAIAKLTENIATEIEKKKEDIHQLWLSLKKEADMAGVTLAPENS